MAHKSEFRVKDSYHYNRKNAVRWMLSHVWRHRLFIVMAFITFMTSYLTFSYARIVIGQAADEILNPSGVPNAVLNISLVILALLVADGVAALGSSLFLETLANRLERDAREELYTSLLGKSQTFHDRQQVGDIMSRATDDVRQLNFTISPGVIFIFDMVLGFVVPIFFIATVNLELLLVPFLFLAIYVVTVRQYMNRLEPVMGEQRMKYGVMNAALEETISGIELVKVSAREAFERTKFRRNASTYRDYFVKQGQIEASYLPLLFFGGAFGLMFLHCLALYNANTLTVPDIIAVMGLMGVLRFPVFISLWSFSLIQMGIASAERILKIINEETDLDENPHGYAQAMHGQIRFESVSFGFEADGLLENISFEVESGQTVAIVGQTGSGKSTLTELVNRTYDVSSGRVLIDDVDVREWNLNSLRSQISKIEQDVFLFSRTIAENIAFGTSNATQEDIERAAREAQAHDFIMSFKDGYNTEIGERGVTLSGGQRQRIALARAFLSNPRILILDDSTSAIDSATEDEIQKALRRAQQGRTVLLITHRLSQIRWADRILVLERGRLIASGTHHELLQTSTAYRRIFARYEAPLPPADDDLTLVPDAEAAPMAV